MKKLLLILTVLGIVNMPFLAQAQTQDSTHSNGDTSAPATPHSGWKTYRGESGSNRYRYQTQSDASSFKEHLFAGGALSLGFYSGEFLIGANPFVGYSIKPWLDAGVAINFQYYSESPEATYNNSTYHNTLLGAGVFARVFPVSFLFLQAQPEYNEIWEKESLDGQSTYSDSYGVFSFLVGGGIKFGPPDAKSWGFISVLFDVGGNTLSPYNGPGGNLLPIFRAGYNVGF
jgi:hypothetical protein